MGSSSGTNVGLDASFPTQNILCNVCREWLLTLKQPPSCIFCKVLLKGTMRMKAEYHLKVIKYITSTRKTKIHFRSHLNLKTFLFFFFFLFWSTYSNKFWQHLWKSSIWGRQLHTEREAHPESKRLHQQSIHGRSLMSAFLCRAVHLLLYLGLCYHL